jgi:hypothetical protein
MKKSIVLLISLFFIAAISALIIKNLDDTDSYISEQNSKFSKTQIIFLINNIKDEVSNVLELNDTDEDRKKDYIKKYYGVELPLEIENAKITFKLVPYTKENINMLKESDIKNQKDLIELFYNNNVYDFPYFLEIYRERKEKYFKNDNMNSYKQIDEILEDFMKKTYSNNILKIKNRIGFFDFDQDKAENDEKYDYYELFIKIEFLKEFIKARYILNKNGKVENFELSFK